ncbi:MAG: thioredoxin domain-containing protein [Bryobacteraceae bacterium]|nr:thioredoxin domain-containing protein [Bryobacteraceae bacterium]
MRRLSVGLPLVLCLGMVALLAQKKTAAPQNPAPASSQAAPAAKSALDKATLEAYVRHLFLWGPQINVAVGDPKPAPLPGFYEITVTATAGPASQQETLYVTKDGQKVVRGNVYDIASNPFQPEIDKLKTEFQPSFGAPGAPVVIAVFSDFQCSYCKQEAKVLRENLKATFPNEVRVYFKDFPIDQIHPWARPAAIAGRCIFRQNPASFWDYHDWIFEKQEEITPDNLKSKVLEFAKAKNLDDFMLGQCMDSKATEGDINQSIAEGRGLRVDSTPTLFINGRRIPGSVGWPQLRRIVEMELDYQKQHANAGEKCCELKLPTPFRN